MIVSELNPVADDALPVVEFRDHLQLGRGFADDGLQDAVLASFLRAAIASIEESTGRALIARNFKLTLAEWRDGESQVLPRAPVEAIVSLTTIDGDDTAQILDPSSYSLWPDAQSPALCAKGWALPTIPAHGRAEIVFSAGFGAWADVPSDLRQAVLMLAAHFYENRSLVGERRHLLPQGVSTLLRPYKPVRLMRGRL